MALIKTKGTRIVGLISVVPQNKEDNLDLTYLSESERDQLILHTGIRFRRRIFSDKATVKKLFQNATTQLLEKMNWDKNSIDMLICVTQTAKTSIPSIACQLHGDMGFPNSTLAYDINSGCSGFVYGLQTVSALLQSLEKKSARAVLCCGDISSSLIDPKDATVQPIFSDAVSAIAIEKGGNLMETTGYFNLETDGSGQKAICVTDEKDTQAFMTLNGIDVFNYSIQLVPNNIKSLFSFAEKKIDFPDLYVFHQANKIINDSIGRKLKLETDKTPSTLYDYGNTASASIPLTLGLAWNESFKKSGWILLSGFGVGFSVASAIIQFDPILCESPIEIEC